MSAVGDCSFSKRILQSLDTERIDRSFVQKLPGRSPGLYAVDLDGAGERSFTYWRTESAVRSFFDGSRADDILVGLEKTAQHLYLSGITLSIFDQPQRDRLRRVMEHIKARGGTVVFDGNYRPQGWSNPEEARAEFAQAVSYSTISLPTFEDEAALFGDVGPEETAQRHAKLGASETVVKSGPAGAYSMQHGWMPPPKVVLPLDTTGAGDSFNAAYVASRLQGLSIAESVQNGHRLAGQVLTTPGAILPRGETD